MTNRRARIKLRTKEMANCYIIGLQVWNGCFRSPQEVSNRHALGRESITSARSCSRNLVYHHGSASRRHVSYEDMAMDSLSSHPVFLSSASLHLLLACFSLYLVLHVFSSSYCRPFENAQDIDHTVLLERRAISLTNDTRFFVALLDF